MPVLHPGMNQAFAPIQPPLVRETVPTRRAQGFRSKLSIILGRDPGDNILFAAAPPYKQRHFFPIFCAAWLGGVFGADKFMVGKWREGLCRLVTLGGLGLWVMADLVCLVAGRGRDGKGRLLAGGLASRVAAGAIACVSLVAAAAVSAPSLVSAGVWLEETLVQAPAQDQRAVRVRDLGALGPGSTALAVALAPGEKLTATASVTGDVSLLFQGAGGLRVFSLKPGQSETIFDVPAGDWSVSVDGGGAAYVRLFAN